MTNARLAAEFLGTAILLTVITGSGVMGVNMSAGNDGVALLANSIATGAGLYVLITLLGPISGAHFNPAVSLLSWLLREIPCKTFLAYGACQVLGAMAGVWLTHVMFDLPLIQASTHARNGSSIWISELLSTALLLAVIRLGLVHAKEKIAMLVALSVTAGYWFTSSTFFANPAVTFARSMTDSFVGIAPTDVGGFIAVQLLATFAVAAFLRLQRGN